MNISVVVPAHNEEGYIGRCLESLKQQNIPSELNVELVVVLNRCDDNTEGVAHDYGATVARNDSKNLSEIKNAGVAVSSGEWIVTVDADSWLSQGVLAEIVKRSDRHDALGGGIKIRPERWSLGIATGYGMMLVPAFFLGLSFGLYWFKKTDFEAIGGFDPNRHIAEDVDFLMRLKKHGNKTRRRHEIIRNKMVTTSCRKFDQFGDWHFVRIFGNPFKVRRAINGVEQEYLDKNWYEVKR